MFNKTFVALSEAPRGPSHVTVHEHRAPTDASIELYHQLLAKARAEVVSTTLKEAGAENFLSHVRMELTSDFRTCNRKLVVAFTLNGMEHKLTCEIDEDPREKMIRSIGIGGKRMRYDLLPQMWAP